MQPSSLTRLAGRFLATSTASAALLATGALAQTAASSPDSAPTPAVPAAADHAIPLERYVVSASRTPQDPKLTPSSVSVWTGADLELAQIGDLKTALARTPGVIVVGTGGIGGQTSVFMRGANSDQVLFFVDGVRMNTADAGYQNFLGGADTGGLDRIEILRGPQSTLYGSSALGGVIAIDTTRGCGSLTGRVQGTAGSFDTFGASVSVQGGTDKLGYSASLAQSETENNRPLNTYQLTSYTTRVEYLASPELLVGTTVRGQLGEYEEAGPIPLGFSSQGIAEVPNHLVTAYAQYSPDESLRSRLTAGWHQTEYSWTDKTYGPSSNFYTRNTRRILDWQNTWQPADFAQLVAGANAEWGHYSTGGLTLDDNQRGLYSNVSVHPLAALTVDLGARSDDHDLEGHANTWRSGVSYRIGKTGTKLRATYGTGFKAPSMNNRFGSPPWYLPSPSIKPEKSKGWDAGVDQDFLAGRLTVAATVFRNDFEDLIQNLYVASSGKYQATNVKTARTQGAELAIDARPLKTLTLRAGYTYLSALDDSGAKNIRLIRRPRHTGSVDAQWQVSGTWLLGGGFQFVSDRLGSANATTETRLEDYTTARLYTSYALNDRVTLKLRAENALNEKYGEIAGYASLPRAVFTSIEWKF